MAGKNNVNPLDWKVPIVNKDGSPTNEFQRKWLQQAAENKKITDLSTPEQVSAVLDVIEDTPTSILVRGTTLWAGWTPSASSIIVTDASGVLSATAMPGDATKFLNGAVPAAFAKVKDSDLSTSDITTNNATTAKHGFVPKLPNDATKYYDGTGAYSVPAGGGGGSGNSWAMPGALAYTAYGGGFATLGYGFIPSVNMSVDRISLSVNVANIGDVYSAFVAAIASNGDITSTVASATGSFTATASGPQTIVLTLPSTALTAGTRYAFCGVITSGSGSTPMQMYYDAASKGYTSLPMDAGKMQALGGQTFLTFYNTNVNNPGSASAAAVTSTGAFAIGVRAQL